MFDIIDNRDLPTSWLRGEYYGKQAIEKIKFCISTYAELFASFGMDWAEARKQSDKYTSSITSVDHEMIEEMKGIASGSGVDFLDILVLNCRTELLSMSQPGFGPWAEPDKARLINRDLDIPDWGECTAICISGSANEDNQTLFAQNWDWKGRQRDALLILNTKTPNGTLFSTLVEAGQLAKIGVSSQGLAIGLNLVRSHQDGTNAGLPIHCLIRHLFSLSSARDVRVALDDLHSTVRFAAASNLPCADSAGDVAAFEVSPAGWAECAADRGVVLHTNHFLCPALIGEQRKEDLDLGASTVPRLQRSREMTLQVRPLTLPWKAPSLEGPKSIRSARRTDGGRSLVQHASYLAASRRVMPPQPAWSPLGPSTPGRFPLLLGHLTEMWPSRVEA